MRDIFARLNNYVAKHPLVTAIALLSVLLLFTPYYGLGYIFILLISSRYVRPLKAFDSYFANFIICALLLCLSIMIAGIFSMLIHTADYAVYNIIVYVAVITPIVAHQLDRPEASKNITIIDAILIAVSLFGPLLIVGAQLSSNPLHIAVYKIVDGDGWDNAAHVSLLQLNDHFKGYIYPMANIQHNDSQVVNSYPQGWHLASSNIASGFGGAAFDTSSTSMLRVLIAYMGTVFAWYVVSMYVFLKYALYLYDKSIKKLNIPLLIPILGSASLLLLLFVLFPSIYQGFINYIAIIPYIVLLVATILQFMGNERGVEVATQRYISFALPLLASITLIWTLPAPALALMCLYALLVNKGIMAAIMSLKRPAILLGVLVITISSLVYAYILIKNIGFSAVYINTGYIAGFPRPELALILVAIVLFGVYKRYIDLTVRHLLLIFSPLTAYMFILWLMSYVKSGVIGYYQSKMFTLIVLLLMLFAATVIMRLITELSVHKDRYISAANTVFIGLCIVGGVVILSGNPLNINSLKRQIRGDDVLIEHAIKWVYSPNSSSLDQLLIFDDNLDNTHNKAMLFNSLITQVNINFYTDRGSEDPSKNALKCISPTGLFYIGTTSHYSNEQVLKRLSHCLKLRSEAGFSTTIISVRSNKSHFERIDTYGAKFEYIK